MVVADAGASLWCASCGLDDDIFGAMAAASGLSLGDAIAKAIDDGVIDRHIHGNELGTYVGERRPYDDLGTIVAKAQATLRTGTHNSIGELLRGISMPHVPGQSMDALSKFLGIVHPTDVVGGEWAAEARRFMKRRTALIAPMYISRAAPSGIVVINAWGATDVFPIDDADRGHVIGLRAVPAMGTPSAVLVESPVHAVVINAIAALAHVDTPPALCPWPLSDLPRPLPVGDAKVAVWSLDYVQAFRWAAAQVNGVIAAEPVVVSTSPSVLPMRIADVVCRAREPFLVIAEHLSELPADRATEAYRKLGVKDGEAHTIINRAPISSRKALADVLSGETVATQVDVGGRQITANPDGWYTDGSRITNFGLTFFEAWTEKDTVIARGEVRIGGKVLGFEEPIELIRRNALKWLERFVIGNGGELPSVSRGWASKIYDIAVALRKPETRSSGDLCRWEDGRLILPTFIINTDGTTEPNAAVDVAATSSCAIPHPPDPFNVVAMNRLADEIMLWTVLLHVAVTATRGIHAFKPSGLVITGPGRLAWQRALRDKLGLATATTAYPSGVLAREQRSVFPVIVEAISDASYREWVNKDGHNAVLVTSRVGARLLRSRGWTYLNATTEPSPAVIAMLPHVITLIRAALTQGMPDAAGDTPYGSIARAVAKSYPGLHAGSGMGMAVLTLSAHARYDNTAAGDANRLIAAVRDLAAMGDLTVERTRDGYVFDWDTFAAAMDSHGLTAGLMAAAARALGSARSGVAISSRHLRIVPEAWRLVETLVLAS